MAATVRIVPIGAIIPRGGRSGGKDPMVSAAVKVSSGFRGCVHSLDRQPADQVLRRLVWRPAVEGHQRGGPPGCPRNLRPPLIARDAGHLDTVCASVDGFFEAVHRHVRRVLVFGEAALHCSDRQAAFKRKDLRRRIKEVHMQIFRPTAAKNIF